MPTARKDSSALLENGTSSGNVLQNDSAANQVTHVRLGNGSYVPVTSDGTTLEGKYGTLTIRPDGSYFYTANTASADALRRGSTGSDTFSYTAADGLGWTGSTTLKFTVTGVNDAPLLTSTTATLRTITEDQITNSGQTVNSFLLSSDVDSSASRGIAITGLDSSNGTWQYSINGGSTWLNVGTVSEGSALLLSSSSYIRFVPNGATGTTAGFAYRAWDQTSGSTGTKVDASVTGGQTAFSTTTATASIAVTDVNDAPVGIASSASGTEDGPPVTGQLQATDVDSSTLTYALVAGSVVGGSVTIDAGTGNYSFTPAAGFSGAASFHFTASDGSLTSASTPVNITIGGVNDGPPVANADSATTLADTPILINVLANDTDPDGDPLSISGLGNASHGTLQIENGQVRYTPTAGYSGSDAFTYTVSDGAGGFTQGNVSVSIAPPTDGPLAVTVTFRQGANGYTGAVDTMLRENRSSVNYGDAVTFRTILESGKDTQALLKFDGLFGTGPGQIPIGATIVSATLTLQVTEASTSGGSLNRMLVNWSAASTWSSLGSGVQLNDIEATAAGTAVGAVALGSRSFNVTDSLAAWNSAATTSAGQNAANFGWVFDPGSIDNWDFTSSQGAVKPMLSITYTMTGVTPPPLPSVSIGAVSSAQENAGKVTFSLTLSQAAAQDVTVTFGTADHTARAGSDYAGLVQAVTFLAGETSKTFDVSLLDDGVAERPETFTVQIYSATNARVEAALATARIGDDDVSVAPFSPISASVVRVTNVSNGALYPDGGTGGYGIGDPSALAYIPTLGALFIGDSEHDESPYNSNTNLFSIATDGTYLSNYSMRAYTREPTGLAYNPNNGFLYASDDDRQGIYWTSPTNPSVSLGFLDTGRLGFNDTEDLKVDPLTGHIYVLDGILKQIFVLDTQGQFVDSIKLPSIMTDAEALAYDSRHDVFFVGSGASSSIWVLDHDGNILQTLTVLSPYSPRPKLKGFELAPSSDPNDGNALSLYVADYGSDQVNDGKIYEIHLGTDWFT